MASTFGALSGSTTTNTGPSIIHGDVGTIGVAITGFPPGHDTGNFYTGSSAEAAHTDANTAYNDIAAMNGATVLTGDLGGMALVPGTYKFSSSAQLTGVLTLSGNGSALDAWYFQIGSTLTTASDSSVIFNGSVIPCQAQVWWQVGSSATLGTGTTFQGVILASASVTMTTGAFSTGGLFGLSGGVTLDTNVIDPEVCPTVSSSSEFVISTTTSSRILATSSSSSIVRSSPQPTTATQTSASSYFISPSS